MERGVEREAPCREEELSLKLQGRRKKALEEELSHGVLFPTFIRSWEVDTLKAFERIAE